MREPNRIVRESIGAMRRLRSDRRKLALTLIRTSSRHFAQRMLVKASMQRGEPVILAHGLTEQMLVRLLAVNTELLKWRNPKRLRGT
jgi:hypothetical protein